MKVIAERSGQYLAIPDGAEPGDDVDGVVINEDGSTDENSVYAILNRGYWEKFEGDDSEVLAMIEGTEADL